MMARLMGLKTVDPPTLLDELGNQQLSIYDVNSRGSWLEARIPGAHHLDPEAFDESDLSADKDQRLVFYCSNPMCRKAPRAAKRAKKLGYREVRVLSAGISGWRAAGLPVESGS
jgi:rhodanese-related sulfurtransferase